MGKPETLTAKQRAFIDCYQGNATQAAIKAGYSAKTARSIGERLLTNVAIAEAVKERQDKESRVRIATRQERQQFWTEIMLCADHQTRDRLKASELLAKSEADFIQRVDLASSDGTMTPPDAPKALHIHFIDKGAEATLADMESVEARPGDTIIPDVSGLSKETRLDMIRKFARDRNP